jgi:hypothetical protein
MVAQEGIHPGHLWVVFVSLKELPLQLVWTLAQINAVGEV